MRYAWDQEHAYFPRRTGIVARLRGLALSRLRTWDAASSSRVDAFVALTAPDGCIRFGVEGTDQLALDRQRGAADDHARVHGQMRERGLAHYHAWAFAGTRQLGAVAELTARWLQWMSDAPGPAEQCAIYQGRRDVLCEALGQCFSAEPTAPADVGLLMASHWQGALLWWSFDPQGDAADYVERSLRDFVRAVVGN